MHINYQLYRLLTFILSPVIFAHIAWIAIRNNEMCYFWQRLGFKISNLPKNAIWFHCASVGEVNTLMPLIKNLHVHKPNIKIIITTNTVTGRRTVKQHNLDYIYHSYLPFDWSFCVKNFLNKVKPVALYIMETEIWPTLYTICQNKKLPVSIINARLSTKTTDANHWIKSLLRYSLSKLNNIYARSEKDMAAYIKLGANKSIITNIGNLKLTTTLDTKHVEASPLALTRDYVLVASTHKDEEVEIFKLWKALNRNELLVIAPRHPERVNAIIKQLNNKNIAVRSKNDRVSEHTELYLLDTIGELKYLFLNAKCVIMGGSFSPVGGHNILEPASYNQAIITGPHMENFTEELALMLQYEAIIQITNTDKPYIELKQKLDLLLNDKNSRESLKNNTAKISHNVEKILNDYTSLIIKDLSQ